MKNRVDFKKCLFIAALTVLILTTVTVIFNTIEYKSYRQNYNRNLAAILTTIKEYYPDIEERDLIDIINSSDKIDEDLLLSFGIELDRESVIASTDEIHKKFVVIEVLVTISSLIIMSSIYIIHILKKEQKIDDITKLLERINERDYSLDISLTSEDELSILKTELYKTTVMLKETAENSLKDKIELKNSLENISHQLKTPLTSIMISLDNLLDDPEMDQSTKEEFLMTIKKETANITFLVQSLLKLSQLDTDTVEFKKNKTSIKELLSQSISNVSSIADLKDVSIQIKGDMDSHILCDKFWQTEAITNIVKNAVEHSEPHTSIEITTEENKIYTSIAVHNDGRPIDKKDLPHVFERFYRGKNAHKDSVGIGLALAKSIIKKDRGTIEVESNAKEGTTFTIKYYHR